MFIKNYIMKSLLKSSGCLVEDLYIELIRTSYFKKTLLFVRLSYTSTCQIKPIDAVSK